MSIHKKLLKGSLILLITFNIFNLFNFLFQFTMARLLTPSEYGVLAALFAIVYIVTIFSESIQTVITKITAQHSSKGEIKNLFKRAIKKSFKFSVIILAAYLLLAFPLSMLLKIKYSLLAFHGLFIFVSFLLPIPRGILQGKGMFKKLGLNLIIDAGSKLLFGFFLVFLASIFFPSLKLYAAVLSIFLGALLAFLFSFFVIKNFFAAKEKEVNLKNIYNYSTPIFVLTLVVIAFYSVDILIAKMVFSEEIAGFYAISALIAKAIFWGTQPISKAMFPISTSEKKAKSSLSVFKSALFILLAFLIVGLLIVYFFPNELIHIFSGKSIQESSNILFILSLSMALLSLSNIILLYKISKTTFYSKGFCYWLALPIGIEILLLTLFSKDLIMFSKALCFSAIIFLLFSILPFKKNENSHNNSSAQ